jgi:DNA-binding NarL/FixJ family response regulator
MKIVTETVRIGLVDQHRLEQDGMKALLGREPNIEVAFTASNSVQCLERMARYGADILLIDFDQDLDAGLQMVAEIRKKHPRLPLLILAELDRPGVVPALMRIGVNGYLLKDIDFSTLLAAIQQVNSGGLYTRSENAFTQPWRKARKWRSKPRAVVRLRSPTASTTC